MSHPKQPNQNDYDQYHKRLLSVSGDAKLVKLADELDKMRMDIKRIKYTNSLIPHKKAFINSCEPSTPKDLLAQSIRDFENLLEGK